MKKLIIGPSVIIFFTALIISVFFFKNEHLTLIILLIGLPLILIEQFILGERK